MTRLNRTLTRTVLTVLTASTLALAGTVVAALTAPVAGAAPASTPDQWIYPANGHVWIDPVSARALSAVPVAEAAAGSKEGLVTLSGPSTTVAVLSTVQHVIDGPVRQAAGLDAGVDVNWWITPDGGVLNTTEVR